MSDIKYKVLLLEGGGSKGLSYTALREGLEKVNVYNQIYFFAGTSIGAFFSLIFCLGLNVDTIKKIMNETNFDELVNESGWGWGWWDYLRSTWKWGKNRGTRLEQLIQKIISLRFPDRADTLTFEELRTETGHVLFVTGTNLNRIHCQSFSPDHTPNMKVKTAVRISMAYPGMFEPILHDKEIWVDGGVMDNFPLHTVMKSGFDREEILAVKLVPPDEEIDQQNEQIEHKMRPINSLSDYMWAVLEAMQASREQCEFGPSFWEHTIPLCVETNNPFRTQLTKEDKERIYEKALVDIESFFQIMHSC